MRLRALCSVTSRRQVEIARGGRVYTADATARASLSAPGSRLAAPRSPGLSVPALTTAASRGHVSVASDAPSDKGVGCGGRGGWWRVHSEGVGVGVGVRKGGGPSTPRPQRCSLCGTTACFSGNPRLASSDLTALDRVPFFIKRVSALDASDASQRGACRGDFDRK